MNDLFEKMKESKKYLKSDENRKCCEVFDKRCSELIQIVAEFKNRISLAGNEQDYRVKIVRNEYSKGGEVLHRGFYCPSPIIDLVIGNCDRGKLIKKGSANRNATYKFSYDINDKLIKVENYVDDHIEMEFIEHFVDTSIGISYDDSGAINGVSRCIFEHGRIVEYDYANYYGGFISNLKTEIYKYENDALCCTDMYDYIRKHISLQHLQFLFSHDDSKNLYSYKVLEYQGNTVVDKTGSERVAAEPITKLKMNKNK